MTLFQISAVLFALFMAYVTRVHHQKSRLSPVEASFWYSLWFIFSVIAIFPQLLIGISDFFYFERVFDLLTVGAFMILSFIVIRSYFMYRQILIKLESTIREQAISHFQESKAMGHKTRLRPNAKKTH